MKKVVLNSPRLLQLKKERRKSLHIKLILIIVLFILLFISFIFISRLNNFNFKDVVINGNSVIDTNKVKDIVHKDLEGYYLYFIPKSNTFLYPKDKIILDLNTELKRIQSISFANKGLEEDESYFNNGRYLEVTISERKALYTWCGEELNTETIDAGKCYFMNDEGYVFDEAPFFSGEVYFKFYGKIDSTDKNPLGKYFNKDIFTKIISLEEDLQKMKVKPFSIYIMENGDIKIYLSLKNTPSISNPYIILKKDSNFNKIEENLDAALTTEPLKTNFANQYTNLEYIDLRFGNKVYYKFK